MSQHNKFPDWIVDVFNQKQDQLNPKSKEFFEKTIEIFPYFDSNFLSIPNTSDVGILKSYDPVTVANYYGLESPYEFILLNICELFHFQAIYQLRELSLALLNDLEDGRFYTSAILNRAMFEVVCVNYYTLRRVESQFKKCLEYLQTALKTRSTTEKSKIQKKYTEGIYKIFSDIFNANVGTSLDWEKHFMENFNATIKVGDVTKIVHVNTAIKDLEEYSGLHLINSYNVLSEFVHPNMGSKMLIVNTQRPHDSLMGALKIGDNKFNAEAALFYIDQVAEHMFYTWSMALTFCDQGHKLIAVIDKLVPEQTSKNVH